MNEIFNKIYHKILSISRIDHSTKYFVLFFILLRIINIKVISRKVKLKAKAKAKKIR